jgi:predicted nucleic-acid-binding protein
MKALDTNVLVRIFVDDDTQVGQLKLARQFAKKHHPLFIPQIVQVELVWVLESAYDFNKVEVLKVLKHLQENGAFALQQETQFESAIISFQESNADFSDCLILASSKEAKCEVITLDKKFSKLQGVSLLV